MEKKCILFLFFFQASRVTLTATAPPSTATTCSVCPRSRCVTVHAKRTSTTSASWTSTVAKTWSAWTGSAVAGVRTESFACPIGVVCSGVPGLLERLQSSFVQRVVNVLGFFLRLFIQGGRWKRNTVCRPEGEGGWTKV